jgi:O-antigen/teichoic acid export membrane protein
MLNKSISNILASIIRMILQIATIPILIKNIGLEEYGLWSLISAFIGFGMLAEFSLSATATTFIATDLAIKDNNKIAETIISIITISGIISLGTICFILLFSNPILSHVRFLNQNSSDIVYAANVLRVGSIYLVARIFQQIITGIAYGYEEYVLTNILSTSYIAVSNIGIIIITSYGGKSLELMQYLSILSTLFVTIFGIAIVKKSKIDLSRKISFSKSRIQDILVYSFYGWISTIGNTLFAQGDRLIISNYLTSAEVGIYSTVINVSSQINGLTTAVMHPTIPKVAALWKLRNRLEEDIINFDFKMEIKKILYLNFFASISVGLVLSALSPTIINILISEQVDKLQTIKQLQIAAFTYSLISINTCGYYILFSIKAVKESAIVQNISGILTLSAIALLSNLYGLNGSIMGNIAAGSSGLLSAIAMFKLSIPLSQFFNWISINLATMMLLFSFNYMVINANRITIELGTAILEFCLLAILFLKQIGYEIKDDSFRR